MSQSVHRIATGVDLDMSQFTRELGRAASSMQSSLDTMLNGGPVQSAAEQMDRQLAQLMEFAKQDDFSKELQAANALGTASFRELGAGANEVRQTLQLLEAEESQVELRTRMMGQALQTAGRQGNMSAGMFNMAVGQMSYAIEDFAAVYETMGASGAFRAASNNLTMVARTVFTSAVVGNVVALGIALGPTLWRMLSGSSDEADKFAGKLDKVMDRLGAIQDYDMSALQHSFKMQDIQNEFVLKPTLDSSDLIAAAESFGLKLREAFRESINFDQELENSLEKSDAAIRTFAGGFEAAFQQALAGSEMSDRNKNRLAEQFDQLYSNYLTRLRLFPESAAEATADFAAQMEGLNDQLNAFADWQTSVDGVMGFQSPLNDAMTTTQMEALVSRAAELAENEAGIKAFIEKQNELLQEQAELEQQIGQNAEERAAIAKRQAELAAIAAKKKQDEARAELDAMASSKERSALLEIQKAQMDLIALANEALGQNFNPQMQADIQAQAGAAMENLLADAAKKFGGDVEEQIDRLRENFGPANRSGRDAATAALVTAMKQQQDAAKKNDPNTEILREIRDAMANNRLVMVPIK